MRNNPFVDYLEQSKIQTHPFTRREVSRTMT